MESSISSLPQGEGQQQGSSSQTTAASSSSSSIVIRVYRAILCGYLSSRVPCNSFLRFGKNLHPSSDGTAGDTVGYYQGGCLGWLKRKCGHCMAGEVEVGSKVMSFGEDPHPPQV